MIDVLMPGFCHNVIIKGQASNNIQLLGIYKCNNYRRNIGIYYYL